MNAVETIRQALKDYDIYPVGEVNACRIYKNYEGWHIEKFGKPSWNAGRTVEEVLEALKDIVDARAEE
jgi:hypothetical protein